MRYIHSPIGIYFLVFLITSCGGGGGGSEKSTNPNISDTTPPVILLNGDSSITIFQGDIFVDPGAVAVDAIDGAVLVTIAGDTVDSNKLGIYEVQYSAIDTEGNQATISRTVNIIASAIQLNDTGVTWGGNYPSGNNTTCTGEIVLSQDCSDGRDANGNLSKVGSGEAGFDFTKLNSSGTPISNQNITWDNNGSEASSSQWSCVKDNNTGLIWEVKRHNAAETNLHSVFDSFTWFNGVSLGTAKGETPNTCSGYSDADSKTYCNTAAFIGRVNSTSFCGSNTWRLPTAEELRSIVNYGISRPAIDKYFFPNTQDVGAYWTSVPVSGNPTRVAWSVSFHSGGVSQSPYSDDVFIRLVHD